MGVRKGPLMSYRRNRLEVSEMDKEVLADLCRLIVEISAIVEAEKAILERLQRLYHPCFEPYIRMLVDWLETLKAELEQK